MWACAAQWHSGLHTASPLQPYALWLLIHTFHFPPVLYNQLLCVGLFLERFCIVCVLSRGMKAGLHCSNESRFLCCYGGSFPSVRDHLASLGRRSATLIQPERHPGVLAVIPGEVDQKAGVSLTLGLKRELFIRLTDLDLKLFSFGREVCFFQEMTGISLRK